MVQEEQINTISDAPVSVKSEAKSRSPACMYQDIGGWAQQAGRLVRNLPFLLQIFGEGECIRDKFVLFPGTVLWVISYVAGLLRLSSIADHLRVLSRPPVDVIVKNRDGRFRCRKGTDDIRLVSLSHEFILRKYFEKEREGVFIDIGANIGKYTVKVARQLGERGKVISIEPEPAIFNILKANVQLNRLTNVIPFNSACWKDNLDLPLFLPSAQGVGGSSSLVEEVSGTSVKVHCMKLDDILDLLKIDNVNFIKIDAEGAEAEIIEGAVRTIARSNSLKILFESASKEHLERCRQLLVQQRMAISETLLSGYFIAGKDSRC